MSLLRPRFLRSHPLVVPLVISPLSSFHGVARYLVLFKRRIKLDGDCPFLTDVFRRFSRARGEALTQPQVWLSADLLNTSSSRSQADDTAG